jgi:hypothetical protein
MVAQMTPAENLQLWLHDRAAWMADAAPRCAAYLATGRAAVEHGWPIMPRDYQLQVWPLLDEATRAIVREVRP